MSDINTNESLTNEKLQKRLEVDARLIQQIWAAMRKDLAKLDLQHHMPETVPEFSNRVIKSDSFDGNESFLGEWQNEGHIVGSIVIHGNGMAFAEYDIVQPHPIKEKWFIEAVTAWGGLDAINSELKLLLAV